MSEPTASATTSRDPLSRRDPLSKRKVLPILGRIAFGICGLLLVIGFFLPWITAGTALELSGLGLVFSGGDIVQAVSGSGRFLLFLVPVLGAVLIAGAIFAIRWTAWIASLGAGALLIFGLIHVISVFVSSTGLGMWIVVFASLLTLVFGLLFIGRRSAS